MRTSAVHTDLEPALPSCHGREVVEMLRKLTFTGFLLLVPAYLSFARLVVAVVVSVCFLVLLLTAQPFHMRSTLFVAVGGQLSLTFTLFAALLVKVIDTVEASSSSASLEILHDFGVDRGDGAFWLTVVILVVNFGVLAFVLAIVAQQVAVERRRNAFTVTYRGKPELMLTVLRNFVLESPRTTELEKFSGSKLTAGRPDDAALGLAERLGLPLRELMQRVAGGMGAIEAEWQEHGTKVDRECFHYVRYGVAGSSKKRWHNGKMMDHLGEKGIDPSMWQVDPGRVGWTLDDFVNHPNARTAGLEMEHVLSLRLYTCSNYSSINDALRGMGNRPGHFFDSDGVFHGSWESEQPDGTRPEPRNYAGQPYPFPATVWYLTDAIKRLRALGAQQEDANQVVDLFRGMKNLEVGDEFEQDGATEAAPMSTTSDLDIALGYSGGERRLFFKLRTAGFMERGASLRWVSAFPDEDEVLYPPLTYLQPTGRKEQVTVKQPGGEAVVDFRVVEVAPHFAS